MGSSYKELFKLYDLIEYGDIRSIHQYLDDNLINTNVILPCKGIGVLHLAVGIDPEDKSRRCTEIILRHGGDPNLCTDDGITPVHIAAIWGRLDNLKLLIGCGGDPSQRDFDGHSAFDYAAKEQQWDVFDYLQHVEDQISDSPGSQCAYTLDIDKLLVTTDQMVAEYQLTPNNQTHNRTHRKSEMVRDWCEKTSLIMNKLYPTILTDTYLIDNESALWRSIELPQNMTLDLSSNRNTYQNTLNDTNISFKTCSSRKSPHSVEISGVKPLEATVMEVKTCPKEATKINKQRLSVYENFSLPCSPNNITHVNYNTKSTLRNRNELALTKEFQEKITLENTLMTEDGSVDLDRLAVAQNKTNEWLSSSSEEVRAMNTRRSSASSGVSSNMSSGNIILANIEEEYKYKDKEEDVVLIEKRVLVTPVVLPVDEVADSTPDQTILSVASSLPPTVEYDNNALRAELIRLGFKPGPILASTRTLYLKKLQALKKNPITVTSQGKSYSIELERSLRNDGWMKDLSNYIELENKARADFANPNKKWREGTAKTSFTYLLLDPRLTSNLPSKAANQSPHVSWITFVNSIFYVGKGKRSRPYSHLYQALTLWKRDFKTSKDKKVQHILDIWSDKVGVVCLHIFQNVIPAEAYTYEAAMIDVLGLANLKNLKSGNYYGAVGSWPLKERRMFGLYLLYKAMNIFMSEGERQLRPDDID